MSDVVLRPDRRMVIAEQLRLDDSPRYATTVGLAVAAAFFVLGTGWAAVSRLDAAASGEGHVFPEYQKQA